MKLHITNGGDNPVRIIYRVLQESETDEGSGTHGVEQQDLAKGEGKIFKFDGAEILAVKELIPGEEFDYSKILPGD